MSPTYPGGGGGGTAAYDNQNRAIEARIVGCLRNENNFGTTFTNYTCLSENHVQIIFGPSTNRRVLATRDITVRLESPDAAYVIKYNTADNTHTVINSPGSFGLSPANLQKVLTCITSNQAGGRKRRYKKKSNTRRVKRKYSHKRH